MPHGAAVCRSSYIDPRVIDLFEEGRTISLQGRPEGDRDTERVRAVAEEAVLAMLAEGEGLAAA